MDVRVTSDPKAFERTVFPFLQQDPMLHTIIMSNVHERVAQRWCARRGGTANETMATRLHKLGTLTPLQADGAPRLMKEDEIELVAAWAQDGFAEELGGDYLDWAKDHM